jgi:hypothetical protein
MRLVSAIGEGIIPRLDAVNYRRYLTLAVRPSIVLRGLKFSAIVGTILVLINHGDTLFTEGLSQTQVLQILLTYAVPYAVSSLSSIQSIIDQEHQVSDV